MSVTNATGFEQLNGYESAVFARAGKPHLAPDVPNGTGGASGTQSTERLKQSRSVLNESADEEAFRLRTAGMTYRQIGEKMGVDQSMAHRRVKRQMMRQKMYLNEKLEEARDFELDKLRQMEQAILPDATSGDHASIKLVLRIMEMRRKYLKDVPLERGELYPSIEDRAEMLAEVVDAEWERKGRPGAEPAEDDPYPRQMTEDSKGYGADLSSLKLPASPRLCRASRPACRGQKRAKDIDPQITQINAD